MAVDIATVDLATIATIITAAAAAMLTLVMQKPYVRLVKMFRSGKQDLTTYKLKNAGAATAVNIILQTQSQQAIPLDLQLGHLVRTVDALSPGTEVTITIPDSSLPVCAHYENLFGLLYHTQLVDAGDRFQMSHRKTWLWHVVPQAVRDELPARRWRRR